MSLVASWRWEFELASEVAIVDSAVAVAAVEKRVCHEAVVVAVVEAAGTVVAAVDDDDHRGLAEAMIAAVVRYEILERET